MPPKRILTVCKSCDAEILWAFSEAGKRIPIDAQPVAGGNVVLDDQRPPRARVVGSTVDLFDQDDEGIRYVTHFSTCAHADSWRNDRMR